MRRFFRDNGLSIVLMLLFLLTWIGQWLTGLHEYNETQHEHGRREIGLLEYTRGGHFWQATSENWESEFLQMGMFVVLSVFLFQKGSPESKDPDESDAVNNDPSVHATRPKVPWPVRRGGVVLWLYSNSLSLSFFLMFFASFWMHAVKGAEIYNEDQREHGQPTVTAKGYLATSRFWFESFQNWQSEFLSLAAMVYLSVYLRQRGSAESKPVATPHDESGDDEPVVEELPAPAAGMRPGEVL